jgi:Tfp pilus assembly major pilin PilA
MELQLITDRRQQGLSLVGFIFVIAIVALIAVLGMKVVPTVVEYVGVKKAITAAKNAGSTPAEIRASFDKQADTGYIESVSGKDLQITKTNDGFDVSVAYEKKIALIGPASLVIDYVAGTGVTQGNKAEQ